MYQNNLQMRLGKEVTIRSIVGLAVHTHNAAMEAEAEGGGKSRKITSLRTAWEIE